MDCYIHQITIPGSTKLNSIMISDIKFIRNLINAQPLQDWEFYFDNTLIDSCSQFGNWTAAYVDCYVRQITISGGTPVGTCKMGAQGDQSAVVDPLLRYGSLSRKKSCCAML